MGGGLSFSAPDWLAPPTKQRPCLINNPKQTRSNNLHTVCQATGRPNGGPLRVWNTLNRPPHQINAVCAGFRGTESRCQRLKERPTWCLNLGCFSDCFTGDRYCTKHSCLCSCCSIILFLVMQSPAFTAIRYIIIVFVSMRMLHWPARPSCLHDSWFKGIYMCAD